ncbi:hypothetical protein AB0K89_10195 [Streptomyces cinnamoneus]|uniref:hypothetical protein n=1 Tax=Streptomyces cinnamoneus TaxID=53446 RepID=UPI00344ABE4D
MTIARETGKSWLFQEYWAFDTVPSAHDQEQYARALMICAAGDGAISRSERDWVKGYFAAFGCSDELLDLLETYEGDEPLESVLERSEAVAVSARALVHDAIRACAADDDLNAGELATIRAMNRRLGQDDELVDRWLDYHQDDQLLRKRRAEIIWPDLQRKPY